MRGQLVITAAGQPLKLHFNAGALYGFCKKEGLNIAQLYSTFSDVSFQHIVSMVLSALEYECTDTGKQFVYTEADVLKWADENEGILQFSAKVADAVAEAIKPAEIPETGGKKKATKN